MAIDERSSVTRTVPWLAFGGIALTWLSFHWDIAFHIDVGRDRFRTAPHLAILAGSTAALAASGWRLVSAGPGREAVGAVMTAIGSALVFVVLAFDDWWHSVFGVDVTVWSPAHLMLILAFELALLGVLRSSVEAGAPPPAVCAIAAFAWCIPALLFLEYQLGVPPFLMPLEPVAWTALFGLTVGIAHTATGAWRWSATVTTAVVVGLSAVGAVFNDVVGRSAPAPALGLVVAGMTADVALRRRAARGRRSAVVGPMALAGSVLVLAVAAQRSYDGRSWWTWPVLAVALLPAAAASAGGFVAGRTLAGAWERARVWPARHVLGTAVAVFAVLSFTAVPLLTRSNDGMQGTVARHGDEWAVSIPGSTPYDWLSVFRLEERPGLRATATWTTAFAREGGRFQAHVGGGAPESALWYARGSKHWTATVERGAERLAFEEIGFGASPHPSLPFATLSFLLVFVVTTTEVVGFLRPDAIADRLWLRPRSWGRTVR